VLGINVPHVMPHSQMERVGERKVECHTGKEWGELFRRFS